MPQINLMQPGQPVANFSVDGTLVVVAGVSVDAAAVQADASVIVEIRHNGETAQIGGDGAYLAHIEVPPAEYSEALVDEESGEVIVPAERLPLDPNTIKITLWPTA
jgi:hypothetical protein